MDYWIDFTNKHGFNSGNDVPADAFELRNIYITVLNKLLEKHGSLVRLESFDSLTHNPCNIIVVLLEDPSGKNERLDIGYDKAIAETRALNLDQLSREDYKKILSW